LPVKVSLASATPLLAVLLWVTALLSDPGPLASGSVLLVGVGLLGLATVAGVGMIVTGGRWARRTGLLAMAFTLVIAAIRPIDPIWVASLAATAFSGVALFSGAVTGSIRKLPAATGPPRRAVLVPLILIGLPFLLGLASWDEPTTGAVVVGLSAPITALWYSRVLPGGLLGVRALWPALAVGLSITMGLAPGAVAVVGGVTIAVLAWHPSVKHAFHPPREVGTSFPIPPELAPREVLDTANLDERGRPQQ
jgi:hypothetical protein